MTVSSRNPLAFSFGGGTLNELEVIKFHEKKLAAYEA